MPHVRSQIIQNVARMRDDERRRRHGLATGPLHQTREHLPDHGDAVQIDTRVRFINQRQGRPLSHELEQFRLLDFTAGKSDVHIPGEQSGTAELAGQVRNSTPVLSLRRNFGELFQRNAADTWRTLMHEPDP